LKAKKLFFFNYKKKNDLLPKNFESAGNDTMGGFGLEQFGPK
jgi:hypothetical protein